MFTRFTTSISRLPHQTISLAALAGLLILRIPFLAGVATFWMEAQFWAYLVFVLGTYLLTAFLIWWERDRLSAFWIDLAAGIVFLCQMYLFPIGIGLFLKMRRSQARFPAPPQAFILWSLAGALLALFLSLFTLQISLYPPEVRSANPASLNWLFGSVLLQMTNAAVWEEPLFRGFLWGYLRLAGWKNFWIWIFQALLFTGAHFYYLNTEPFGLYFVRMMLPALLLGLVAWCARSIFASMVTHGFLNATGDVLMHAGSLEEALSVTWMGIWIVGAALLAAVGWRLVRSRMQAA
jgi:membrane protease YdiL (CAAX protease family)